MKTFSRRRQNLIYPFVFLAFMVMVFLEWLGIIQEEDEKDIEDNY